MLAAIIILSLLSLLVATEADPSSAPADPASAETLRPSGQSIRPDRQDSGRLAA